MITKYRAWDKKSKKIREVSFIVFDTEGSISLFQLWGFDIIGQKDVIIRREPKDVILLQFTGFVDKHGKEVHHKDLVKTPRGVFVIDWNQLHNCWALFKNDRMYREIVCDVYNSKGEPPDKWQVDALEIIGNVFDNPELV